MELFSTRRYGCDSASIRCSVESSDGERGIPCTPDNSSQVGKFDSWMLIVSATAGGPAFESGVGSCGAPAEAGAVFCVSEATGGRLAYRILDDDHARGLCGSGLVDLVACLRRSGQIGPTGKFADGTGAFAFAVGEQEFALTLRDVDALQRAKAAIGAGIAALGATAGVPLGALRRIVVAGLFGRYLDIGNAQAIGLLPPLAADRIELAGNTAAAGAAALLISRQAQAMAERLRRSAKLVNLAHYPDFDDAFIDHLYLRPMQAD